MGKWLNRIKDKIIEDDLNKGDRVDSINVCPGVSTLSLRTSHVEKKNSPMDVIKLRELKNLIKQVSKNYGGDDEQFLENYINDVIKEWSHDLDKALACFRELSMQKPIGKGKKI